MIFRCLSITATVNTERSKGRNTNQDNSGTIGVVIGVREIKWLGVGAPFGAEGPYEFGVVRKGTKLTVPKLKSFLKS
jgi:hypothetical protein